MGKHENKKDFVNYWRQEFKRNKTVPDSNTFTVLKNIILEDKSPFDIIFLSQLYIEQSLFFESLSILKEIDTSNISQGLKKVVDDAKINSIKARVKSDILRTLSLKSACGFSKENICEITESSLTTTERQVINRRFIMSVIEEYEQKKDIKEMLIIGFQKN